MIEHDRTRDIKTPQELLTYWEQHRPDSVVLKQPVDGVYLDFDWRRVANEAKCMASALKARGLEPGDRVAILSKNCAHWFISDLAIMLGGFVSVPIYPTANLQTVRYILEHSECKVVFVGKLDAWQQLKAGVPETCHQIGYPYGEDVGQQWDEVIAEHKPIAARIPDELDLMTILYTSGSTGKPKGAMHNYRAFLSAGRLSGSMMRLSEQDRLLSYLPLAHCTERAYVQSTCLNFGQQLWFVESLATFSRDLKRAEPTVFGSVPRLWTQFQNKIHEALPPKRLDTLLSIPLVNHLVRKKIRRSMGLHKAKYFLSGSAPLGESLIDWYKKLGIHVAEGWGMTETFAFGTLLTLDDEIRPGTIGKAGKQVSIKITEEGEITIKSPTLMQGYYKAPESTTASFSGEYFRTGDKGVVDGDGYVKITGRIKEIFKTAKGKYVAPAKIEGKLSENPYIDQQCVLGTGMTQPVALIQLTDVASDVARDVLEQSLRSTFDRLNQQLESHEKIGQFFIVSEPWTVESGLLTPTLKIKRNEIEEKYMHLLFCDDAVWLKWEANASPSVN